MPWPSGRSSSTTRRPFATSRPALVQGEPASPVHIAFAAPDRETVERVHAAVLASGGRDNGGPGERPHYHPATTPPTRSTPTVSLER